MPSNYKNLRSIDYDFPYNFNKKEINKEEKWIKKNTLLEKSEYNIDKNFKNEKLEGGNNKLQFHKSKNLYYNEMYTFSEDVKAHDNKNNPRDNQNEKKKEESVIMENNDLLKYREEYKSNIMSNSEENKLLLNNKRQDSDYIKNERNLKRKKINEIINKYRKTMKIYQERSIYDDFYINGNNVNNPNKSNGNLIKNSVVIKEIKENNKNYDYSNTKSIDNKKKEIKEIPINDNVELRKCEKNLDSSKGNNWKKNYTLKINYKSIVDDNNKYKSNLQLNFSKNKNEYDYYSNHLTNINGDKNYLNYYSHDENKTNNTNNKDYRNAYNIKKVNTEEQNRVNIFNKKMETHPIENKRNISTDRNIDIDNNDKINKCSNINRTDNLYTNSNRFYLNGNKLSLSQQKRNYLDYEREKQIDFKKSTILKNINEEEKMMNYDAFNSDELKNLFNENKLFDEEKKIRDKFKEIELMEKSIEHKNILSKNGDTKNNNQKISVIETKEITQNKIHSQEELKKNSNMIKHQIYENNKQQKDEHHNLRNKISNNDKNYSNITINKKVDLYNNIKVNNGIKSFDELKMELLNNSDNEENINIIKKYKNNSETVQDDTCNINNPLNTSVIKSNLKKSDIHILKKNNNYKENFKINKESINFKKENNIKLYENGITNNMLHNNFLNDDKNKNNTLKYINHEIKDIISNHSLINTDENKKSVFYDSIEPLHSDQKIMKECIENKINKIEERLKEYDYKYNLHDFKIKDIEERKWNYLKIRDCEMKPTGCISQSDDKKKEEMQLYNNEEKNSKNLLSSNLKEIDKREEKDDRGYLTNKSTELNKIDILNREVVDILKHKKILESYEKNITKIRKKEEEEKVEDKVEDKEENKVEDKEEDKKKNLNEYDYMPLKNNVEKNFIIKDSCINVEKEYLNENISSRELPKDHVKYNDFINVYKSKNLRKNNKNYLSATVSDENHNYKIKRDVNRNEKIKSDLENKEIHRDNINVPSTKIKYDRNFEVNGEVSEIDKANNMEYARKYNYIDDKKNTEVSKAGNVNKNNKKVLNNTMNDYININERKKPYESIRKNKSEKELNGINGNSISNKFVPKQNSVKEEIFSKNNAEKFYEHLKNNSNVKKYQNPLYYSVDLLNKVKRKNNNKNVAHDIFLSGLNNTINNQNKNENIISFKDRKMNVDENYNNMYLEEKKKNLNEKIKEKLEMIKRINDEQKIKIDEENKLRNEINLKRKLYELKIRKEFEEKIRIRRKLNEQEIVQEKKEEHMNCTDNDNKEKEKEKEGATDKEKEMEIGKEKEKEKKKKLFEDYSSDGSYYKYVYRNLYEETCNKKVKNYFYDISDNLYLQECSDNFFHNNKSHSSIDNSISNSFDQELISLSKIKFDDFDYNYLNEHKISKYTKKENSSFSHKSESDCKLKNKSLIKPKVILTDSENNCAGNQKKNRTKLEEKELSINDESNNENSKRDMKNYYVMKTDKQKSFDYSKNINKSNEYKKNNEILNKLLNIKHQNKIKKKDIYKKKEAIVDNSKNEKHIIAKSMINEENNTNIEYYSSIENNINNENHGSEKNHTSEKDNMNEVNNIDNEDNLIEENNINKENNKYILNKKSFNKYTIHEKQLDHSKNFEDNERKTSNKNSYEGYNEVVENKSCKKKSHIEKSNISKIDSNNMEHENNIKNKSELNKKKEYYEHLTSKETSLDENEEKKKDDDNMKSSLSSSGNIIPKINILQDKENYIPLDVALNFVMDSQKLKKSIQKENKGTKKKKTFVQWLMEERKKRLKNNLPIDI